MKSKGRDIKIMAAVLFSSLMLPQTAFALDTEDVSSTINNLLSNGNGSSDTINTFLLLTLLSLLPVLLIMMTSFTRIIMVLSFVRSSLGTQQNPPNQVLIGLALFLTFFIMKPVYTDVYQQAIEPFDRQEISQAEAFDRSEKRIKAFMMVQTREKDMMSMGMMMLSPIMISLPFKILLFVLVDGWYLIVESLIKSFQ